MYVVDLCGEFGIDQEGDDNARGVIAALSFWFTYKICGMHSLK